MNFENWVSECWKLGRKDLEQIIWWCQMIEFSSPGTLKRLKFLSKFFFLEKI